MQNILTQLVKPPIPALLILSLAALIAAPFGRYFKDRKIRDPSPYIAILALALTTSYFLSMYIFDIKSLKVAPGMILDGFSIIMSLLFSLAGLFIAIAGIEFFEGNPNTESFNSLLLLSIMGMIGVSHSTDLIVLFVSIALFSVPSYALVALRKDPYASEAAIKYFIISAFSTALILYAISMIYGLTGTTDIQEVAIKLTKVAPELRYIILIIFVLLLAGIGFEMAIVPFHMWIPDAYDGAPPLIASFLAAAGKLAGFTAFIRLVVSIAPAFTILPFEKIIAFLAIITMTLGNIAALMQTRFTRLLAYSSIAHAGYALVGLAFVTGSEDIARVALTASLLHLFYYVFMKGGAFIAAAAVEKGGGASEIEYYKGLGSQMPLTAFSITILLMALTGVPPLNGFWSKYFLLLAAINGGMPILAIALILNSAFSAGYYFWVIKRLYLDRPKVKINLKEPKIITAIVAILAILTIVTGLIFPIVYDMIYKAAFAIIK